MNAVIEQAKQKAESEALCLQAVWELNKLAYVIPGMAQACEEDLQMHFAVRGICARMLQLTTLLMECMGDSGPVLDEMKDIIHFAKTGGAA